MNIVVAYHSSTGNTKKLAEAIASAMNVKAMPIGDKPISFSKPVDLLFVGDGIYFGKASKETRAFIDGLDPAKVKNSAVFATYGGQSKIVAQLSGQLRDKGMNVIEESFSCRGKSWAIINRKHPSEDELSQARDYTKRVAAEVAKSDT